ncbi:MAG: hypothetical protein ACK5KS_11170 [Planctomyces sp.]
MKLRPRCIVLLLAVAGISEAAVGRMPADEPGASVADGTAWVTREVRAPRVSFHKFDSAAAKSQVSYHLYLPAAYERDRDRRFRWCTGCTDRAGG